MRALIVIVTRGNRQAGDKWREPAYDKPNQPGWRINPFVGVLRRC